MVQMPTAHSNMTSILRWKNIALFVFVFLVLITMYVRFSCNSKYMRQTARDRNHEYTEWPPFDSSPQHSYEWFKKECIGSRVDLTLDLLHEVVQHWHGTWDHECRTLYEAFISIFTVTEHTAKVIIPDSFAVKVRKWLGNKEELFNNVKEQTILFLFNEYTHEQNVYNPLREKRPKSKPEKPELEYVAELSKKTAETCDFCNYKRYSAEDTFGRIESKHSFTASNTFKLDTWHALILTRKHDPIHWTFAEYIDLMDTARRWVDRVYNTNRLYKYPMFVWDLLPHAGASQVHPHLHGFVDTVRYQGVIENWRIGAEQYTRDFPGRNYFTDFVSIHTALGLTARYKSAVAVVNLVPKRDNEVVVLCSEANDDFFRLLYFVIRAYLDDMEKLCFSSGIAFPSMDENDINGKIPAYVRIVTRGAVADVRTDFSSLELFTSSNANSDPYKVIAYIRKSIEKRTALVER